MSLVDIYRRNVSRKREEIVKLQKEKAKEQEKIASLSKKIHSASTAISKTRNASTIKSKLNEIERHQKNKANAENKFAEIENKIAKKHKELNDEQKKVSKEEEKELKKRNRAALKQTRQQAAQIREINSTITKHDFLHEETQKTLVQLQTLPEKIVVLFLASNPTDQKHQLRLDEEARSITEMIRKTEYRDSIEFETRWAIRPEDIFQAINELNPVVIHFSGHGSERDEIALLKPDGTTKLVGLDAIIQTLMVYSDDIRLVFFNTCHSHNQARVVTEHVEAAIGMNTSIGDEAARIFSSQFYSALGFGSSLQKAFNQAKARLMMENITEENIPELFVQDGYSPEHIVIVRPAEEDDVIKNKKSNLETVMSKDSASIIKADLQRLEDVNKLIEGKKRRLQKLREKSGTLGHSTPPEILMEIEDIEKELKQLQSELDQS